MKDDPTKKMLLEAGDGPDGITIYTSEEEAVVDWAADIPALYIEASLMDAQVKLGPFTLSRTLIEQIQRQLK